MPSEKIPREKRCWGDVERILPYVGERVEASVDLDEPAGAHSLCQLAPRDAGIRHLSRGDVTVAVRGYVHQSVRGGSSLVCVLIRLKQSII